MLKLKKILSFTFIGVIGSLALTYFILQTSWGSVQISRKISDYTPYYLLIGTIDYKISQPHILKLNHVIFGYDGYPALAMAKQVTIKIGRGKFLFPTFKDISADQVILAPANLPIKPVFPSLLPKFTLSNVQVLPGRKTPEFLASTIWMNFQQQQENNHMFYHLQAANLVYRDTELNNVRAEGEITKNYLLVNCVSGQLSIGIFEGYLSYSFKYGLQQQNFIFKDF